MPPRDQDVVAALGPGLGDCGREIGVYAVLAERPRDVAERDAALEQSDSELVVLPARLEPLVEAAGVEQQPARHRGVAAAEVEEAPRAPGLTLAAEVVFPPGTQRCRERAVRLGRRM